MQQPANKSTQHLVPGGLPREKACLHFLEFGLSAQIPGIHLLSN